MAVAAPGLNGCTSSENVNISMTSRADTPPTNSVSYFGSWESYQIPFVPVEPISQEEAQKRRSYYVGYYNRKLLHQKSIKNEDFSCRG